MLLFHVRIEPSEFVIHNHDDPVLIVYEFQINVLDVFLILETRSLREIVSEHETKGKQNEIFESGQIEGRRDLPVFLETFSQTNVSVRPF